MNSAAHARERLPEHAVPAAFVRIGQIPMAASAKVDPSLLPAPTRFHRRGVDRVEPSTPIEERLCEIWGELLGLEGVGVTDSFFDLGGASLSALETVAAIDAHYGTNLPDAVVFRSRTVRELAVVVSQALADNERPAGHAPIGRHLVSADGHAVGPAPLSAGEEAMLFEYRMDPANTRYNVTRLYTIGGMLDTARFRTAMHDVIMLHGPLHTSYGADRRPLSGVEALSFVEVPATTHANFERLVAQQRTSPFDLDDGPLVRVHIGQTGPDECTVLISLHHITIDAGTFDLLWTQIVDCYTDDVLPTLEATYAEHADWQRQHLSLDAERFWQEQSAARHPVAVLGLARPQEIGADGYLSRVVDVQSSALAIEGNTAFATSMAAVAVVLSAYTAEDRIDFGITASTKDHAAAAPLVGYYLNTLPMGIELRPTDRFADLVHRAAESIAAALPHRGYPFAFMVRDARAAGYVPPDISFMLAYEALATPRFPDAPVTQRIVASGTAVTDVTFFVQDRVDSIQLGVEYSGSVVTAEDAERLLSLFESVVVSGTREPSCSVRGLTESHDGPDLVGDRLELSGDTVLTQFLAHVDARPAAVAVVDAAGVSLTYQELAVAVDQLARRIEDAMDGLSARRVGVSVGRSTELIVAILAAQCCGAAYVPLDPSVGPHRLERIVAMANLDAVLVGETAPRWDVPTGRAITVGGAVTDGADVAALRSRVGRVEVDDVAYVIFTSGSTGQPRGVEVTHRNLAASTEARAVWYEALPPRFLVTSSIGFDSSIVGLFWPLTTGGAVVLPDDEIVRDVDRIGALIDDNEVTHVLMVPSLYRALLDRCSDRLHGLEVAIVAGESCPRSLVVLHEQLLGHVGLINEYGPTEATVWSTAHRLSSADEFVPIGEPIPGTTTRIVDSSLTPVPSGVSGELMISGPGVTDGYLDDEATTTERFVLIDDRVWYRTGDVVRLTGGLIEFVGRADEQLNIGGNRLEPGEVETALCGWPGIREAVVVAASDPPVLVAHLEADAVNEVELRASLALRLPTSSIPRRFVCHERLPRTSHGKLDRTAAAALPVAAPDPLLNLDDVGGGRPTLDIVVSAWRSALNRSDVDAFTDFFAIGGDSLAAAQVVSDVGEALGRVVPIAALLTGQTPSGMAAAVDEIHHEDMTAHERSIVVPGNAFQVITLCDGVPTGMLVVMTPAWDDVFGYRDLAAAFPDDCRVVALVYAEQPGTRVVTTVDDLSSAFLPLVEDEIRNHRPVALLGWSVGGVVAAELSERLTKLGLGVDAVALIDTFFPGEERHLWSNRWWKYKSLLRPNSLGEAGRELGVMGIRRVKRLAARLGRELLLWSGTPLPTEPERTSVGGFPVDALAHDIQRVSSLLVFYRAATTNPERTLHKWRHVAVDLVDVEVSGRHRGFDSIMGPGRVDQIAGDLVERLRHAP